MTETATLDSFDLSLLKLVQVNNLMPARMLAEKVGLSESAVLRRLRQMRANGTIAADVAIVRPASMGLPLTIHVLVSREGEAGSELEALIRKIKKRPEVRQANYVTGEADFILMLQLSGMEQYDVFTREVFHEDGNVKSFTTLVTIRDVVNPMDAVLARGIDR
jgi:DNA-binding Lrp family transcriptional regulator